MYLLKTVLDGKDSQDAQSSSLDAKSLLDALNHNRTKPVISLLRIAVILLGLQMIIGTGRVMAQRPLGIDVSSYQGSGVNWSSVKGSGVSFAWAKAAEATPSDGYIDPDPDFAINIAHAKAAGVPIGAYYFDHPELDSPSTAAAYFWSVAGSSIQADGLTFIPMLDFETFSGVTGATSYAQWANAWCSAIQTDGANNGLLVKPVIYISACKAGNLDSSVSQWSSDIANYGAVNGGNNPQTGTPWSSCAADDVWGAGVWNFWQYSSVGSVPGVSGNCDVDVLNGTAATLQTFVITTINNPPAITAQPQSATVTLTSNVTFTATVTGNPAPTYQWKFNGTNIGSATKTTYTITNVQTNNGGNYSLFASNSLGTATSSNALLTVYVPLTITAQPTNVFVVLGSNTTFTVAAIGTPAPTYQWQFNSVNIPSATTSSLALVNVQSNKQGSYSVSVSNSSGSLLSSNATLTVVTKPAITVQPASSATVNQGGTTNFSVTATGTAPLSWQWQLGGSNIAGANASTYTLSGAQPNQAGNYQVVVTNNYGAITSAVETLTVIAFPVITGQPQNLTVPPGSNATFSVTATGPSLAYQWRFNTAPIGGATGTSYTVFGAQTNNAGNYSVVVSNAAGVVTSSNALLTISPPQPPQFLSVTMLSNGLVQMVLSGQTGSSYEIDGSSNLVDWAALTNFLNTNGTFLFTDPASTNHPAGFYRAKTLP